MLLNMYIYFFLTRCIRGHLKDKVVILVTHQLHFLKNVDKIIVLRQGEIVEVGTYHELMTKTSGRLKMLLEDKGTPSDTNSRNKSTSSLSIRSEAMNPTRRCSQNIALESQMIIPTVLGKSFFLGKSFEL